MTPVDSGDKPNNTWTIAQITDWLDTNKIDHAGVTLKADLLALVPTD